jgi:hypothetical protein
MEKTCVSVRASLVLSVLVACACESAFAGSIVAWGDLSRGQGDVPAGNDFIAVAAGSQHSVAIRSDRSLLAWGSNEYGQCNVSAGNDFVRISGAWRHTVALKSDGSIVAWGWNEYGQCSVPAGDGFVAIAASGSAGFAVRTDGSIVGWGSDPAGLGLLSVPAGNDFVDVETASGFGLALKSDGSLVAWGVNERGQCDVPAGTDFVDIACGWRHGVALRSDGSLVAWGYNEEGECDVPPGNNFVKIATGGHHSVALRRDGSLAGWGPDWPDGRSRAPAGKGFVDIAAYDGHSVALKAESATAVLEQEIAPLKTPFEMPPDAVKDQAQVRSQHHGVDLSALKSPVILKGDAVTAYRNPAAIYHDGVFRLFYSYVRTEEQGKVYHYTAVSKSRDLAHWTEPRILTAKDQELNHCAPGNIIWFKNEWIMCVQSYPTPKGEKHGDENARVWIVRSTDLENWSDPEMLMAKGPDVPPERTGRLIDPYLVEDKDEPGKWWCFFDDNAANMSYSYDLKTWTYFNRVEAGENVCVLVDGDEYLMFHSPKNGIGMKRSTDLKSWRHVGGKTTKEDTGPITLGQKDWPWAQGRLSAGFVLDMRDHPDIGKYLMFFHGTGPQDESVIFNTHACIGIAWSNDLTNWDWPEKKPESK